jgi:hypothetical protein
MLGKGKSDGLRVYELVDGYVNFVDAEVSCGYPRGGGDSMELVKISELLNFTRGRAYVTTSSGDSMVNAGISDSDYVVIDIDRAARPDEVVLAEIEGEYLLKYYVVDRSGAEWLMPGNERYSPIRCDERCRIRGVGIHVIHQIKPPTAKMKWALDTMDDEEVRVIRLSRELPSWAKGRRAKALLDIAVDEGLIDGHYQPLDDTPMWKLGGLADRIGETLELDNKWTRFGELWNRKKDVLRIKWNDMKDMSRGVEFRRCVLDKMM